MRHDDMVLCVRVLCFLILVSIFVDDDMGVVYLNGEVLIACFTCSF